jgi:hypothetical protein
MFRLAELQKTAQQRLQPVRSLVPEPPLKISEDKELPFKISEDTELPLKIFEDKNLPLKISEDKSKFTTFELKVRAGQPAGKYVRVFEEGSPQEWIDLAQDLRKNWAQNSINGLSDCWKSNASG